MSDPGPYPYMGKTISEVVHDYAVVRGDLVEKYARDQLVDLIERRIAQARRDGAAEVKAVVRNALGTALFDTRAHRDAIEAALRGDHA